MPFETSAPSGAVAPVPFHGLRLRQCRSPLLRVEETVYPPLLEIPAHTHGAMYLGINVRGTAEQWCGRETRLSEPGSVTLHPAGELHSDRFGPEGAVGLNIELLPPLVEQLRGHGPSLAAPVHVSGGEPVWLAARFYREFRRALALSSLALEGLLLEIFAHLLRLEAGPARQPPAWLTGVREAIHDRLAEPLSLAELARVAGVHPVHLSRSFRRFTGCTVADYIRRRRVEAARRALAQPGLALAEIALASGFADQSQFSRAFRALVGASPRQYRRLLRG